MHRDPAPSGGAPRGRRAARAPIASGWAIASGGGAHRVSRAALAAAVAIAAIAVIPVAYLVVRAAEAPGGLGGLADPTVAVLAARSLALALAVAAIATALALALAVAVEAIDLPLRRAAAILVVLPLAIPSYVAALAYVAGVSPLGPIGGVLARLGLGPIFPTGFAWAVFILVTSTVPLAFLPLRAALARADGELYDAARTLGQRPAAALAVALRPVLGRAARGGFAVVALYSLAELGTVAILRVDVLPRVIYHQFLSAFDRASAARSALVLVALVLGVLAIAARATRAAPISDRARPLRLRLGRARLPALALVVGYVIVATVVPVVSLVASAARAPELGAGLGRAVTGSVVAAAAAVAPALVAAVIMGVVAERGGRVGGALARFVDAGYALPGLVVALGLSVAVLRLAPALYQGWAPYAIAMLILYAPLGATAVRGALATVAPVLEDAARTLGATRRGTFWRVTLPIVWPGVLAAAALIAISTMKDLGASLLLLPTGTTTLAVRLWDATEEARYGLAAAPALALIGVAAIATFGLERRRARGAA
jgi:iron(III) transport system permease protein